mgnify:CR=1 FL=1
MFGVERNPAAAHDKAAQRHIRCADLDHVARLVTLDDRHPLADQRERLVDHQRGEVDTGGHVDRVARLGGGHGGVQVKPRLGGGGGRSEQRKEANAQRKGAMQPKVAGQRRKGVYRFDSVYSVNL